MAWRPALRVAAAAAFASLPELACGGGCSLRPDLRANTDVDEADFPGVNWDTVCTTPSSAHISMQVAGESRAGGAAEEDQIVVDILHQGPLPWSVSRFNHGDLAPRLGPRWPASQTNLGIQAKPGGSSPVHVRDHPVQAWRPHRRVGVVLATVAKNGQDDGAGATFYGTVAAATNSGGLGFSMVDGTFGEGDCDIAVGKAGNEEEGDVDVAVAWIPYAAGFLSGYVAAPETPQHAVSTVAGTWEDSDSHSSDFESGWSVTWVFGHEMYGDHAVVSGRGGLGRYEDGMLFAIATDSGRSNNKLNTVGVRPMDDPPGWRVKVHEDNDPSSGHSALPEESMFAFVVVPFVGTIRLHAAWVNGMTGVPYRSTGNMKVMRTGVGTFLLQVGRKGEKDGVLLLQTAGGNASSISCAFLSYEWNELRRAFEVQARHVSTGGPGEERFLLVDVDFYALWMDHKSPPVSVAAKLDQPPSWAGCFLHKLDQMFDLDDCVDSPLGWRDKLEKPCTDYAELEYCTRSGGYGSGWLPQMGDFSNWSGQGHDASTACCACGGGSSMKRAKYMGKDFSVTTCVDACEGFTYAAVQSGQCRCGDFLPDEATRLKDSECGTACPFEGAEPSLQCGADGRNAVYRTNFVMLEYLLYYDDDVDRDGTQDAKRCETVGEEGVGGGVECTFPFVYGGRIHRSCTTADSTYSWCATAVNDGEYVPGMFGRCSEQCEVLEPCECQESWQSEEDPGCAELQLGCPAVPCDAIADPGSYEPWCKVKNPGCATEEFKGWSYCSGLLELGGGGGVPWLGPLRQSEGQGCAGGLRGEAGYRGNLATTLEQCKALCAAEEACSYITFYTSVAGCEEEACLVGLQPTRCRLSESCELAPAGDLLAVVFQKQAAASDWEGTPSARFRKGFLLGALTIGLMAVCLMCGPCFKLERQSARGDLIFNNGRTILEGADTDDRTDPI